MKLIRFGKNGSDATAGAVRVARAYTGREHVAVCGYHGWQDWYIGSTSRHLGVPNAVKAFLATNGAITDRVMAAMDAADASGGDSRCTCPPPPADGSKPAIACEGRTAYVAYILMAEKGDIAGDGAPRADNTWAHNNGKYSLYLTVAQPEQPGPNAIKPGENLNPVKTLRARWFGMIAVTVAVVSLV